MLDEKVFIVAGGGHGLGKATAVELGKHGASVVVNDLGVSLEGEGESEEPAEETAAAVRDAGGRAMAHFGDITSVDYTEQLIQDTVDEHGHIDGAINFAGIVRDSISYKMSADEFDDVVHVHLRGHFALLRNLAAHWRAQADKTEEDRLEPQRSFVSVVSPAIWGNVGQLNYVSAKSGIMGMTRVAAVELNRFNVRVNSLMPLAFTRMVETIPEEYRSFDPEEKPPEKVAPVAAYLLSDEAKDITGCTIRAAGDEIGIVSNPQIIRRAYKSDGWSLEDLTEKFRDEVAQGVNLTKNEREFGP